MKTDTRLERLSDWTVGLVSAKHKFLRKHFRRMARDVEYRDATLLLMRTRGYRAGKMSSTQTPWLGGSRSADAEITGDLPKLRDRSRELNRDDPIGSGITGSIVRNVVGTGMRPQARTKDTKKNTRIEAVWKERANKLHPAEDMTYAEAQNLKIGKVFEDGEVLVKRTKATPEEPVWFEIIEADRLATPMAKKPDEAKGSIRNGVEKDEYGRPMAYWIRVRHPGDNTISVLKDMNKFIRVPAADIKHLRLASRPGQTRGVPAFHAVLQDIRDLDLLMLASLKRVQIAACLAVFVKSDLPIDEILDTTSKEYGYQLDQSIEPGMIYKLYPTEEIQTLVPNFPVPELEPFIVMLCRRIGAALGLSWQVILKDFSKSTYSSARTDLLESRQVYTVLQMWFAEKELEWEWFTVMEDARLRGDIRLAGVTEAEMRKVHWIANGWKWVDPQKEAKATEIELRIGTTTLRDVAAAKGQDWEEMQDQRLLEEKAEQEKREKLGLPPKPPPGAAGAGGAPRAVLDEVEELVSDLIADGNGNRSAGGNGNGRRI